MAEYRVSVFDKQSNTTLETWGPFYVKDRAERQAKKLSRFSCGPDIIVSMEWTDLRDRTHVKRFCMGKIYRP